MKPLEKRRLRLAGAPRFVIYLLLQVAILSLSLRWIMAPLAAVIALGMAEGQSWPSWVARSRMLLVATALPAIVGIPWGVETLSAFMSLWSPSLLASVRLVIVLASASWLSSGMSPVELRDALSVLLRPLGKRTSGRIARAASLTMSFIPWTAAELRRADEAAKLRGSNPAKRPVKHLVALSVPLVSRSLEKARRGSEALSLRDSHFGS